MSTYVEDKIGRYPNLPTSGSRRPDRKPRNSDNNPLLFGEENPDPGDLIGNEEVDYKAVVNFTVPGCYGVDPAGGTPAPPLPVLNICCVDDESSIPNAVFHSDKHKVYSNFCRAAYGNRTPSRQFRWLAQPRLPGPFVGEDLVFLLFKGKLIKHANHRN